MVRPTAGLRTEIEQRFRDFLHLLVDDMESEDVKPLEIAYELALEMLFQGLKMLNLASYGVNKIPLDDKHHHAFLMASTAFLNGIKLKQELETGDTGQVKEE